MKSANQKNKKQLLRTQILKSAIASFKIEGITISKKAAIGVLKKVELNLEKQT